VRHRRVPTIFEGERRAYSVTMRRKREGHFVFGYRSRNVSAVLGCLHSPGRLVAAVHVAGELRDCLAQGRHGEANSDYSASDTAITS
jgi:hypothetical protein